MRGQKNVHSSTLTPLPEPHGLTEGSVVETIHGKATIKRLEGEFAWIDFWRTIPGGGWRRWPINEFGATQ